MAGFCLVGELALVVSVTNWAMPSSFNKCLVFHVLVIIMLSLVPQRKTLGVLVK